MQIIVEQKNHDDIANKKQLYLVEQREDTAMFPLVVGVPETVRTPNQINSDEILDFQIVMNQPARLYC